MKLISSQQELDDYKKFIEESYQDTELDIQLINPIDSFPFIIVTESFNEYEFNYDPRPYYLTVISKTQIIKLINDVN